MLIFGSKTVTIDGITVFADHADPNQFWYLPGPVALAKSGPDKKAEFSFIKYKPAAVSGGAKGGGFLSFKANLQLDPALEQKILSEVSPGIEGKVRLSAVQFDEGSVECVALNLQGSGGKVAIPAGPGTFNAVENILGASVPSLFGENSAAFSLTLSQEGAIIIEKAFNEGLTPVGIIYNLKFTGLRPALDVKITADLKKVYTQFSASLSGQYYFFKAGIDAGFEKLVQSKAIKIEVTNFITDEDKKEKEKWALDFFKDKLLNDFFEPTLSPGKLLGETPKTGDSTATRSSSGSGIGTLTPKVTPQSSTTGQGSKGTDDVIAKAKLEIESVTPDSQSSKGYTIKHTPSSSGISERLEIVYPANSKIKSVKIDGSSVEAKSSYPIDVPAGARKTIIVEYSITSQEGTEKPGENSSTVTVKAVISRPPADKQGGGGSKLPENVPLGTGTYGDPEVALKLKVIRQEEQKTVTLEYHSSEAVVRSYVPQGFLGMLLGDQDKHFLEVDLDNPFFRTFTVTVEMSDNLDFSKIGLNSAHISIDYGNQADEANHKHGDFIFDTQNKGKQKFEVSMNKTLDTFYRYKVDYNFDPQSGWDGQSFSYQLPARSTEDRVLNLNPYNDIGFLDIEILPNKIDWGVVNSIDVNLNYQDQGKFSLDRSFRLTSGSKSQFWRLRLNDPKSRSYSYSFVYYMEDGSIRKTDPVITKAPVVAVDDPFKGALDLEFMPLFEDPARIEKVFIDVAYKDPENNYEREERLQLMGNATNSVKLRMSLVDPKRRKFSFRTTFVNTNPRSMNRGPFVETEETLISVSENSVQK